MAGFAMSRFIHAPDGGGVPGSLCQREGDLTAASCEFTCPECDDILDAEFTQGGWGRLAASFAALRDQHSRRSAQRPAAEQLAATCRRQAGSPTDHRDASRHSARPEPVTRGRSAEHA